MYLHEKLETLTRSEIEALQWERLQRTLERCMNSPFYRKRFADAHLTIADIRSLDDLQKIPFTTKQDLRDNYPFGLAAVPMSEVVRLHSSSGTTGTPTVILHTQKDLDEWANAVARCLYMVGLRRGDVFQNSSGYGMFTGGLGFQYGAERLGMLTVPAAAGNTKRQIKFIRDFGTTALHAIPSYASRIHEVMEEMGVTEQNGMHIWEDYYIVEIVDPVTLEPVPDGEVGELVLTTINREAMPLLRYRTRDLTRFLPGECPCGRHHRRLDRMKGRSDDMMILKGVNIFPIQIETVLMQFEELGTDYLITLTNEEANDLMTVEVELKDFSDDYARLQALTKEITRQLKDEILLTPLVKLVPKGALPKQEGKAVRVRDLRKTLI